MNTYSHPQRLFSCVIPLVEKHDKHLPKIFQTLAEEQDYIHELIIARSELKSSDEIFFKNWISEIARKYSFNSNLTMSFEGDKRNAAQNRNRGASLASAEWLTFLDADDEYSNRRLRTLAHFTKMKCNPNLLVHSYLYEHEIDSAWESEVGNGPTSPNTSGEDVLILLTQSKNPKNTNLQPKFDLQEVLRIHHGHLTVRKEIFDEIQFSINSPGSEDGIFCSTVAEKFGSAYLIPESLSIYQVDRSATNLSFRQKLIRRAKGGKLSI